MKKPIRLMHVDDDKKILELMQGLVGQEKNVRYEGGFTDAEDALTAIRKHAPDLLVLDVEMPNKDGLWLAQQLKGTQIPIVFMTSHMHYAYHAFQSLALDYLLKPIDVVLVKEMLVRYYSRTGFKNFNQDESIADMKEILIHPKAPLKRIFINSLSETAILSTDDIMYIKASNNCCTFTMRDHAKHTSTNTLKTYEESLEGNKDFLRTHRSFLINKNFVTSIQRKGRDCWLVMADGELLDVVERLRGNIVELLEKE